MTSTSSFPAFINAACTVVTANNKRLPVPYKLTYAITYRCNSRCTLCSIWKKPHVNELTVPEIEAFFQTNTYFNWIHLTGGEVFLHPHFFEIVQIILRTQPNLLYLNFPTNGLLTERIEQMVKHVLTLNPRHLVITVSLDGTPRTHDRLRGIQGSWKRAVATYKKLKQLQSTHFQVYFGMTISQKNYAEMEETYRMIKQELPDLSRSDIHVNIAHNSFYYGNENQQIALTEDIAKHIQAFTSKKRFSLSKEAFIERQYQKLIPNYIHTKKTPLPCQAYASSLFLDPMGMLYPCSMWDKPLGSIKNRNFDIRTIWNIPQTEKILALIRQKKCPNCWTPCEAYQSILGNVANPILWRPLCTK